MTAVEDLPQLLWRERLALAAAEACMAILGRPERAPDLRDAVHLLRSGDRPGPAGDVLLTWRRATSRSASPEELGRILPGIETGAFLRLSPLEPRSPVANAAVVLEAVLAQHPKAAVAALVLADAVLARGLKWSVLVPLLGAGLKAGDLRKSGDELVLACHRSVVRTAASAGQIGVELQRRANKLKAVAPKLRGKGAGAALTMFLSLDAVAPVELVDIMSDRSARRLCDRLVKLGAIRELTGRDSFRLYGV